MEFYAIPIEDSSESAEKFILFRPLLGIAFLGNQATVNRTKEILAKCVPEQYVSDARKLYPFLSSIGFLKEDPIPPAPHDKRNYKPTHAVLLMTNQCQLRCIYCYASGGEFTPETLDIKTGKAAIDEVYQNANTANKDRFSLSFHGGGEPMLAWKTIRHLVEYAKTKDLPCRTNLTSNGVWSNEQIDWVIKNIDSVTISMDGAPQAQNRNRPMANGLPSSDRVMKTIHHLDQHQKHYAIRMTVISPWEDFPTNIQYLCEHTECKNIQVEPAFNSERGEHTLPTEEQSIEFCEAYLDGLAIAQSNGVKLNYSGARTNHTVSTFCGAPSSCLIVNPNNELITCYEITSKDHPLASISHIGDYIDGEFFVNQMKRENLLTIIEEKRASCRDCFCYWGCAGDCYSRTMQNQNGKISYQYSRCMINQYLTKELILQKIEQGNGVAKFYSSRSLH